LIILVKNTMTNPANVVKTNDQRHGISALQDAWYSLATNTESDDEERRLKAIFEKLRADEQAAITHPRQSLLYPARMKLVELLEAARYKCSRATYELQKYRNRGK
jgi:hypothetical protein